MHKKVTPDLGPGRIIGQFPHCDQRVLHAPGECQYCDRHRDWQELRAAWGIAFTGYEPDENELPDPATRARPLAQINLWPGNVATNPYTQPNGTAAPWSTAPFVILCQDDVNAHTPQGDSTGTP